MSGVMVLPCRSWHTTGWRRQLPEDRIAPADTSNKRTQAPFLRHKAEGTKKQWIGRAASHA
ncbi:unnamed protein product [Ectocarpus sp. 4 AP-2014]